MVTRRYLSDNEIGTSEALSLIHIIGGVLIVDSIGNLLLSKRTEIDTVGSRTVEALAGGILFKLK